MRRGRAPSVWAIADQPEWASERQRLGSTLRRATRSQRWRTAAAEHARRPGRSGTAARAPRSPPSGGASRRPSADRECLLLRLRDGGSMAQELQVELGAPRRRRRLRFAGVAQPTLERLRGAAARLGLRQRRAMPRSARGRDTSGGAVAVEDGDEGGAERGELLQRRDGPVGGIAARWPDSPSTKGGRAPSRAARHTGTRGAASARGVALGGSERSCRRSYQPRARPRGAAVRASTLPVVARRGRRS